MFRQRRFFHLLGFSLISICCIVDTISFYDHSRIDGRHRRQQQQMFRQRHFRPPRLSLLPRRGEGKNPIWNGGHQLQQPFTRNPFIQRRRGHVNFPGSESRMQKEHKIKPNQQTALVQDRRNHTFALRKPSRQIMPIRRDEPSDDECRNVNQHIGEHGTAFYKKLRECRAKFTRKRGEHSPKVKAFVSVNSTFAASNRKHGMKPTTEGRDTLRPDGNAHHRPHNRHTNVNHNDLMIQRGGIRRGINANRRPPLHRRESRGHRPKFLHRTRKPNFPSRVDDKSNRNGRSPLEEFRRRIPMLHERSMKRFHDGRGEPRRHSSQVRDDRRRTNHNSLDSTDNFPPKNISIHHKAPPLGRSHTVVENSNGFAKRMMKPIKSDSQLNASSAANSSVFDEKHASIATSHNFDSPSFKCTPREKLHCSKTCDFFLKLDDAGCETCECCEMEEFNRCDKVCRNGYVADKVGCPICICI